MVHNGIEYGMMQSVAEGFELLKKNQEYDFSLKKVAEVYNHGSVIQSRLVGWLSEVFEEYGQELANVSGTAQETGEATWAVETAQHNEVDTPVIHAAVKYRTATVTQPSYQGKIITALRNQFGGHSIS
jgi:6-phosphogluconate dehydrogenase